MSVKADYEKEVVTIPIKDLSFFNLNLRMAIDILKTKVNFTEKELKEYDDIYEKYVAICHYWSAGQYYEQ